MPFLRSPFTLRKGFIMRDIIKLVSSAGTGYFYTTTKNRKLNKDKIERKKYDPVARKHVVFKEKPIK